MILPEYMCITTFNQRTFIQNVISLPTSFSVSSFITKLMTFFFMSQTTIFTKKCGTSAGILQTFSTQSKTNVLQHIFTDFKIFFILNLSNYFIKQRTRLSTKSV